jgi:DegV family protein with EDD domain
MKIGLVTDSPSDLPADIIQRHLIRVVPATLVLGGIPYLDGIEITRSDFYHKLPNLRESPSTAAPASEAFSSCYRNLFQTGCEHVIGIFTAEKLTAIADIARKAADEFNGKISVIESGSLSMGSGYQVLAAAEAIAQGMALQDVLDLIQSVRERTRVYAALDTMEYLRRSGRVPQAVARLGGLLNIKPVVELREGSVKPLAAARTTKKATETITNLLAGLGKLERLSILHTNAENRAREFLEQLVSHNGLLPADIRIINVTTVIGTHVGPNGLGFAAVMSKL